MPGVVTKTAVFTNFGSLYRIGGMKLVFAVLIAKPGTPFLTVFTRVTR